MAGQMMQLVNPNTGAYIKDVPAYDYAANKKKYWGVPRRVYENQQNPKPAAPAYQPDPGYSAQADAFTGMAEAMQAQAEAMQGYMAELLLEQQRLREEHEAELLRLEEEQQAKIEDQRLKQKKKKGRRWTMFTGPQGLLSEATLLKNNLLGAGNVVA